MSLDPCSSGTLSPDKLTALKLMKRLKIIWSAQLLLGLNSLLTTYYTKIKRLIRLRKKYRHSQLLKNWIHCQTKPLTLDIM